MDKVEDAKIAQERIAFKVQKLYDQNLMLKDKIAKLQTALNKRFLKLTLHPKGS